MKPFVPLSEHVLSITQLISLLSLLCAPVLITGPSGKVWILSHSSGDFPLCNPSEPANCNFKEKGGRKKGGKNQFNPRESGGENDSCHPEK